MTQLAQSTLGSGWCVRGWMVSGSLLFLQMYFVPTDRLVGNPVQSLGLAGFGGVVNLFGECRHRWRGQPELMGWPMATPIYLPVFICFLLRSSQLQ